jgi:hypothetical protein
LGPVHFRIVLPTAMSRSTRKPQSQNQQ